MGSIQKSGANTPPVTLQQTAAVNRVSTDPVVSKFPTTELKPIDAVNNISNSGNASPHQSLQGNAHKQVKDLLQAGEFDKLEALINSLPESEIEGISLSVADIQKLSEGLGNKSYTRAATYTTSERNAVSKLIKLSNLSNNQKVASLKANVGTDAVLAHLHSSTASSLSNLSEASQNMLIAVLDPKSSIWGKDFVAGALEEGKRRLLGNGQANPDDQAAVKVLRSVKSEPQLLHLLNQINEFNRDDVVYLYVKEMGSQELAKLSDNTKKALLNLLIDTSLKTSHGSIDFNAKNIDEFLGIVSEEHQESAQKVVAALSPEARNSAEVKAIVNKSDGLVARLGEMKKLIDADIKSNTMDQAKLAVYQAEITDLKAQATTPEAKAQIAEIQQSLDLFNKSLQDANQIQRIGIDQLGKVQEQISKTQNSASELGKGITAIQKTLQQQGNQIETLGKQIEAHYTQVVELHRSSTEQVAGTESLLLQIEDTLKANKPTEKKLAQLKSLQQKVQQLQSQYETKTGAQTRLQERSENLNTNLQKDLQSYESLNTSFNQNREKLITEQAQLKGILNTYQNKVNALETLFSKAEADYKALPENLQNVGNELTGLEGSLNTAKASLQNHQNTLRDLQAKSAQTAPAARKIEEQAQTFQTQSVFVAQTAKTAQTQLTLNAVLLEETDQTLVEGFHINDTLLNEIKNALNDYEGKLNNMSGDELGTALKNIGDLKTRLANDKNLSATEFKAQYERATAIENTITQIKDQLEKTQALKDSMSDNLKNLNAQKQSISSEINAAQEAITQAKSQQAEAAKSIAETQSKMTNLSGELSDYKNQLQQWEQKLADLDAGNEQSKNAFVQGLNDMREDLKASKRPDLGKINASKQEIRSQFGDVAQKRQEIEKQLASIRTAIQTTEKDLGQQKTQLEGYRDSLTTHMKRIESTTSTASNKRKELEALNRENRALSQQIQEQFGAGIPPEFADNQHIRAAVETLKDLQKQLGEDVKSSEASITESAQHEANTLVKMRELNAARKEIEQQLTALAGFEDGPLKAAKSVSESLTQEFAELKANEVAVKAKIEALKTDFLDGKMSIKAFGEAGVELLGEAKGQAALEMLFTEIDTAIKEHAEVFGKTALLETAVSQEQRNMGKGLARMGQKADDITSNISKISEDYAAQEKRVGQATQDVLQHKKHLLEQRKTLGITAGNYQNTLAEYEAILSRGGSLSVEDKQKMHALEGQLSRTENSLVDGRGELQEKIKGLNALKSEINASTEALSQEVQALEALSGELSHYMEKASHHKGKLTAHRSELVEGRAKVLALIKRAKNSPLHKTPDFVRRIAHLEKELKTFDESIKTIDDLLLVNQEQTDTTKDLMKKIEAQMVIATRLMSSFAILIGKISETTELAEQTLQGLNDLLADVETLKAEVAEVINTSEPSTAHVDHVQSRERSAAVDISSSSLSGEGAHVKQSGANSGGGLVNQLSDQLTNLLARRRRDQSEQQEKDFQQHQDEWQKNFRQQMQDKIINGAQKRMLALQQDQELDILTQMLQTP